MLNQSPFIQKVTVTRSLNYQPKNWFSGKEQIWNHCYKREGKTVYIHEEGEATKHRWNTLVCSHTGGKLDWNTTMTPDFKIIQEVTMTR